MENAKQIGVVWWDTKKEESGAKTEAQQHLKTLAKDLKMVHDVKACEQRIPENNQVFLVLDNALCSELWPHVHSLPNILAVLMFGADAEKTDTWRQKFPEVISMLLCHYFAT